MKKWELIFLMLSITCFAFGRELPQDQDTDSTSPTLKRVTRQEVIPRWLQDFGEEVSVTAPAGPRDTHRIPHAVTVITEKVLDRENHLSIVDVFDDNVGIWVEKRTLTTSDPVIRGLSGSNLLALIDGNTLSSFWGEGGYAGDDMYGKIDPDSIVRVEVVRGPQSVLYGSNALGGVLNFITQTCPLWFPEQGIHWGFHSKPTYGTAGEGVRFRQEVYAAMPAFRFIAGGSY